MEVEIEKQTNHKASGRKEIINFKAVIKKRKMRKKNQQNQKLVL